MDPDEHGRASFEASALARGQQLVRTAQRWEVLADGWPDAWVRTVIFRQHVSWWRRTRRESVSEEPPSSTSATAP